MEEKGLVSTFEHQMSQKVENGKLSLQNHGQRAYFQDIDRRLH